MQYSNFQFTGDAAKNVAIGKEEKALLEKFDELWGEAHEAKQTQKMVLEQNFLAFRSIMSDYTYTQRDLGRWGLAVFVPFTFQTIAGIESQLNGRPPQYRIAPANVPSDSKTAEFVGKFSRAEFRRANAQRVIADATQTSLIFGTSFLRSKFRYDAWKKKFIADVDEATGKPRYEERLKTFYKGWSLEEDHPLQVYLPKTHAHDKNKWPFYIVRDLVDIREVKAYYDAHPELSYKGNHNRIQPGGDLTDDLACYYQQDILYRLPSVRYPGSAREVTNSLFPRTRVAAQLDGKHMVERFRVFFEAEDEWAVIVHGRVVEYHPNPLESTKELPVTVMRDYEIKHHPWGMGEPELIRWLQFEANSLHNLALDSSKYSVSPVFAMNGAYLQDEDEFEITPGKIIHLKNIPNLSVDNAIQALNLPEVKSSIFKMLDINEDVIRKTTGAGSFVVGGDAVNPTSATESNNLKAAATTRIYDRARRLEQDTLCEVIRTQLSFMAEFYDEEMTVKVTDQEFYKFLPGSMGDYSEQEIMRYEPVMDANGEQVAGFDGVIFGDDLAQGYDVYIEGESTLPITKADRRQEGLQLLKLAAEARRPFTQEEIAANPQLPALYPQGAPILDASLITTDIVLPGFTSVENTDRYLWKVGEAGGPDRTRGVGRPPDAFAEPAIPTEQAMIQQQAQPADLGVNMMENV